MSMKSDTLPEEISDYLRILEETNKRMAQKRSGLKKRESHSDIRFWPPESKSKESVSPVKIRRRS
jgi:hypothetical protein